MGRDKSRKFFKQKYANQKKIHKKKVKNDNVNNDNNENNNDTNNVDTSSMNAIHDTSNHLIHAKDFEDNISLVSEITIDIDTVLNDDQQNDAFNELNDHFDELNEKDSETRILALNKINHALKHHIFDEYFRKNSCDKLHGLIYMLIQCLRRGNVEEQKKMHWILWR